MKMNICFLALMFSGSASASCIVTDGFETYTTGSIVGQGGWESSDDRGYGFVVQSTAVLEGLNALYVNASQDNIVGTVGNMLSEGRQVINVMTDNRNSWASNVNDGNAQIRLSNGLWGYGAYVTFRKDGHVTFYDGATNAYTNFATYEDNSWTTITIEWRADATARYQVNEGEWTGWQSVSSPQTFSGFNYVGFDFDNRGGSTSGGVYFDALGANYIPEPSIFGLLVVGGLFLSLTRKKG